MYKYIYNFKIQDDDENYQPVVLVTGCSSGIGFALAKHLIAQTNYRLVLTAREKSIGVLQTEFAESDRVWILPLDIVSEESRLHAVKEIFKRWGRVDVLINNAGISYRSVLEEMLDRDELLQMQTNYLGPVGLIRLLLPRMRQNGRGKIINISSVSGMLAMPTMASYSASKFALEGAMEALWYETRTFGIDVVLVQPGFVRSRSHERVKYSVRSRVSTNKSRPYTTMYRYMSHFIGRMMHFGLATPDSIAHLVLYVIRTKQPPLWVPAAFDAEFFYYLKRFFPRRLILPFFYWFLPGSEKWGTGFSRKRKRRTILRRILDRLTAAREESHVN